MAVIENIKFIRRRDFKFLKEIGQGGTGRTILIHDETINETFVCKKYSTFYEEHQSEYYDYFINEIKILHTIFHENVVRIFNYYLYPEKLTGYIVMEYVEGYTIEQFLLQNPDKLEDVFIQVLNGFRYLEENQILHRDIRPENILTSESGAVKIIDFGFGKNIEFEETNKSISLNWRYEVPSEFDEKVYDSKTEVYFVGKLFEEIVRAIGDVNFKYAQIVSRMIIKESNSRIQSFFEVYRDTIDAQSYKNHFSEIDKIYYQNFANGLHNIIKNIADTIKYNQDIDLIVKNLDELYRNSMLEEEIQDTKKLIRIFLSGSYNYYPTKRIKVSILLSFVRLLQSASQDNKKLVINNLWERIDSIARYSISKDEDLPF